MTLHAIVVKSLLNTTAAATTTTAAHKCYQILSLKYLFNKLKMKKKWKSKENAKR